MYRLPPLVQIMIGFTGINCFQEGIRTSAPPSLWARHWNESFGWLCHELPSMSCNLLSPSGVVLRTSQMQSASPHGGLASAGCPQRPKAGHAGAIYIRMQSAGVAADIGARSAPWCGSCAGVCSARGMCGRGRCCGKWGISMRPGGLLRMGMPVPLAPEAGVGCK